MKPRFVPDFSADMFAIVEGVCDTPLHIHHLFVGNSLIISIILFYFSPLRFLADKEKGV